MNWTKTTRRNFLKSSALIIGSSAVSYVAVSPSIIRAAGADFAKQNDSQTLDEGWEHFRGTIADPWEVWNFKQIAWQSVPLPHCFNQYDACDPDAPAYRGQGWYRTRLKPQNPYPNGRVLLHFGGAGQNTTVYVGNKMIGKNVGGYNEFVFDITDAEKNQKGEYEIAVLCDNSRRVSSIPADLSDFTLYGGIYRHVRLVYTPAIALEMTHIQSSVIPGQAAQCSVQARLYNPGALTDSVELSIEITGPTGIKLHSKTLRLDSWQGNKELDQFPIAEPALWSPSSPALYRCAVTIETKHGRQSATERFGLRHIEFQEHGPFLLNGKKLFLRGTQRHEDHADYAAAVPDEITRQEFRLIRDMGANFIRLAHYPQTQLVLDLCDELGLIVWEELPWCRAGVGDEEMRETTRRLLRTMIDQHYNHPSIVFWSLGNEDDWPGVYPGDDKITLPGFMQQLHDIAHEQDPSRFTAFRRCEVAKSIPDVYSPSVWDGWYNGRYQDYERVLEQHRGQVRHFLHMEWGADSHARRHAEEPYGEPYAPFTEAADKAPEAHLPIVKYGDWSETYACDLFDWYLGVQERIEWLAGTAQWIFKDFTTQERPENPVPRVNQKGLVERDLTKKESYFVFQSWWAQQPMVHIYGHSWPVRWGAPGQSRLVRIYSNCDSAEVFLNGKSCGSKKRDPRQFPCAGLYWNLAFREGENVLRVVGRKSTDEVSDEIRFTYQTAKWGKPVALKLTEKSRSADRIVAEVKAFDANQLICLDARNRVRFQIAGDGKLNDNLGTSTGSRVVELYNGRAEISLIPGTQASILSAEAENLMAAFLKLG